jgi:isoleucyl-tRNA synthetase
MAVFDFKKTEERIRDFWKSGQIFEKSLDQRKDAERFVFYEGPPTANGKPHIGHFLTRTFKDLYGRYKTMRGFYVLRKAGWDTHGLPVELEIEKELGFKNKKDIEAYGIDKFNKKAKESVWKYKKEWEEMTERMAFWIDLKHPYVTYETSYIESLWSIIRKIADRDLLYQAHRVVPFCTRCGTPLSSHEVAQGYKLVKENSVYLKFKLKSEKYSDTSILAWTTTPWTLPGNLALAVGKDITYVVVATGNGNVIVAKELAEKVVGTSYHIESEMKGEDLVGLEYEPLFDIPQLKSEKSYRVYAADFVSTQDGTGVVHTAVMYGEDDYKLGTELGLPKVHTVDEAGKFIGVSSALDGKYVKSKETETLILEHLSKNGTLFKEQEYEHDYPFCWRCDTPLLYYAKTSWFIKMSAVNKQLLENNESVNWIPAHLKTGRFGQWLKEGKDWAFSRERYWGTPLPVWQCQECKKHFVVGSLEDLEKHRTTPATTFYLVRHGETTRGTGDSIIVNSYPGEHDTYDLTDAGKDQAQKIAQELKDEGVEVVVSSPFKRTQQTAKIISEMTGALLETDERLGELRHGLACEGKPHNQCDLANPSSGLDTEHSSDAETRRDVRTRMMETVKDLEKKYPGKKIAIVSHGDPIWMLASALSNLPDHETMMRGDYPHQGSYKAYQLKNYPYNDMGEVDLHRPYVDEIILKCEDCESTMRKVPDLIDVWFDSGSMPYAQWHWPFENKDIFKEQFPADYIVEAVDQTRGWFYTLLAVGTLLEMGAPYRAVMSLGHVLDENGKKLSKSKKNYVEPNAIMDEVGVDTLRWFFYTVNAPGDPTLFNVKDVQERLKGFLATLENCVRFYELYEKSAPRGDMDLSLLDQWMLSKLNRAILDATQRLDEYDPTTATRMIEKIVVDDLSKWWLRRSRNRPEAIGMLKYLLFVIAKLIAPFAPYTAEDVYARIGGKEYGAESVHLLNWPHGDKKMVNDELEAQMQIVQEIITKGLAIRKDKQIKVRQPLQSVTIPGEELLKDLEGLIKDELNVKEIRYQKTGELSLDLAISQELQAEGYAREMIRQIQDMRKDAGYAFDDRVLVHWHSADSELVDALTHWEDMIEKETVLRDLIQEHDTTKPHDVDKEVDLTPGKKIWIAIQK